MKIRTWEYFIREVFISLKRNNWMTFASISTVAVSLLILGLFLIMVLNLNNMATALESQVQINVYLHDDLSDEKMEAIGEKIQKISGVEEVQFVTKKEAMERFKQRLGDQQGLLTALGEVNPLPNAFEVKLNSPEHVKAAADAINTYEGVENAKFGQEVIDQLFELTKMIRIFGFVIIVFLAFATIFIISNTIRLTVFARRKEIGIMKYVGATDWFIRWPFLMEGMVLGFVGSIVATMVLRNSYGAVVARIYETLTFLPLIPEQPFLDRISILMIVVGTAIGALGSTISLKRFMKV
ncbi:permease-like cell division protein FtsX [Anaerosinus massiliensis]|uniref:permease-like cell division protein FtsX n=1 Tax=Massilibacillus massiliensis TaxID=1806837 RepID=UPI000AA64A23|nr:permease-like cell division protein FtsX [Massilibacillus massiliensis]